MSLVVTLRLGGKPAGKGAARAANGWAYTPAKTRFYLEELKHVATEFMGGRPPLEGALAVTITAIYPPPKGWPKWRHAALAGGATIYYDKKPDWDNLAKTLDALNQIVWRDDAQVAHGSVRKLYGPVAGLEIIVRQIPDYSEIAHHENAAANRGRGTARALPLAAGSSSGTQ